MSEIVFKFDPLRDIRDVDQTGYVDLALAFAMNSIPANIEADVDSYNGIEDPASILGSPKDVFEAAQMRESIGSYNPPSNNPDGV